MNFLKTHEKNANLNNLSYFLMFDLLPIKFRHYLLNLKLELTKLQLTFRFLFKAYYFCSTYEHNCPCYYTNKHVNHIIIKQTYISLGEKQVYLHN